MMKKLISIVAALVFISCSTDQDRNYNLSKVDPALVGFDKESLERIDDFILSSINNKEVAGTSAIIIKDGGVVYHKAFGMADIKNKKKMEKNTIVAIASMSKLMSTVGALIIYDRGLYNLDTRLDEILPEFKDPKVFVSYNSETKSFVTRAADGPILMKHLFTHTSGLVYPFFTPPEIGREGYMQGRVYDAWSPDTSLTLEENIKRLSSLPLVDDPGKKWHYGLNMDVLGRVIEVLDGRSFALFMKEEIFDPLGLRDTGFRLPKSHWKRVAKIYSSLDGGGTEFLCCPEYSDTELEVLGQPRFTIDTYKQSMRTVAMGGADIYSTAYDYARFLQMLLNGGTLDGARILGRKTVEMINRPLSNLFSLEDKNTAMGLSVGVVVDDRLNYEHHSTGSYFWGGYFYTSYWVDPKEKLIGVIMNQINPSTSRLNDKFHQLVYSALD